MNNQLTVLIPTSPIPSHPSTAILDETISNVRRYTDARIIIMADGCHKSFDEKRVQDYKEYIKTVKGNVMFGVYGDCHVMDFKDHTHQCEMTKQVLKREVDTPLVMFVEHDTSPIGDIPFQAICDLVENNSWVDYVRFNIFEKIPLEHRYLMLESEEWWRNNDKGSIEWCYIRQDGEMDSIPLTPTIQYSQRPNIAKTSWYRTILDHYFPKGFVGMIEDKIHGVIIEKFKELKQDIFHMHIYAPPGNQLRSYHSDGRGTDEKIIEA